MKRREFLVAAASAVAFADPARDQRWRADLQRLATELPRVHPDFFARTPRAAFDAAVAALDQRIPDLSDNRILIECKRLVAMGPDGHTALYPQFRNFPIAFRWLDDDGLYVTLAAKDPGGAAGARVIAIGGVPIAEAQLRVLELVSNDDPANVWFPLIESAALLAQGEVLLALGLAAEANQAVYTLENYGDYAVTNSYFPELDEFPPIVAGAWRSPLLNQTGNNYWFQQLPGPPQIAHLVYSVCYEQPGRPLAAFLRDTFTQIDAMPLDTPLVVDLRLNGGGDSSTNDGFVREIRLRKDTRPVYGLIGRQTFSSGMWMAKELEQLGCVLIGEPTGGKPVSYGNVAAFVLPNCREQVRASRLRIDKWLPDNRPAAIPAVRPRLGIQELGARMDPALAAVAAGSFRRTEDLRIETLEAADGVIRLRVFTAEEPKDVTAHFRLERIADTRVLPRDAADEFWIVECTDAGRPLYLAWNGMLSNPI